MKNNATIVGLSLNSDKLGIEWAFKKAWPKITELKTGKEGEFILCAVCEGTGVVTAIPIIVKKNYPSDIIVGRHQKCDLQLDNEGISLRHILARFYCVSEELYVRFIDLNTKQTLFDESGKICNSLLSNGHLFVRFAGHFLLAVNVHQISHFKNAHKAWQKLPRRDHLCSSELIDREGASVKPRLQIVHADSSITQVIALSRTSYLSEDSHSEEIQGKAIGALIVDGTDKVVRIKPKILTGGLLIGRYSRCQIGKGIVEMGEKISRVHLCLLLDDTGIWAIDVASTNGTMCDGKKFRSIKLSGSATLMLGSRLTLHWQPA